jgi:hypothetical protein
MRDSPTTARRFVAITSNLTEWLWRVATKATPHTLDGEPQFLSAAGCPMAVGVRVHHANIGVNGNPKASFNS